MSITAFLYERTLRKSEPAFEQWVGESQQMYSEYSVCGIPFIGPEHYVPVLELTLDTLRRASPEAYDLVKKYITSIYTHPHPIGGLEFGRNCAFACAGLDQRTPFVWNEYAGYLVRIAKINQLLSQNCFSALYRWSRGRKEVRRYAREVVKTMMKFQGEDS